MKSSQTNTIFFPSVPLVPWWSVRSHRGNWIGGECIHFSILWDSSMAFSEPLGFPIWLKASNSMTASAVVVQVRLEGGKNSICFCANKYDTFWGAKFLQENVHKNCIHSRKLRDVWSIEVKWLQNEVGWLHKTFCLLLLENKLSVAWYFLVFFSF